MPPPIYQTCQVTGCSTNKSDNPDIKLHYLPEGAASDPHWITVLQFGKPLRWLPKKGTRICSLHFEPEHFTTCKRRLLPSALPSRLPVQALPHAGIEHSSRSSDLDPHHLEAIPDPDPVDPHHLDVDPDREDTEFPMILADFFLPGSGSVSMMEGGQNDADPTGSGSELMSGRAKN